MGDETKVTTDPPDLREQIAEQTGNLFSGFAPGTIRVARDPEWSPVATVARSADGEEIVRVTYYFEHRPEGWTRDESGQSWRDRPALF